MSTLVEIKSNIRTNLNDAQIKFWPEQDVDESVQDAYDDVVARTKCIIRRVTLDWVPGVGYIDFTQSPYNVTDFMGVIAIRNNVNNRWLEDNWTTRNLDSLRVDWELQSGTPARWLPTGGKRTIIHPYYENDPDGTFDLIYYATAPVIDTEDTSQEPEFQADAQVLLEIYSTADLLEHAEEFTSAINWWKQYYDDLRGFPAFMRRCRNLAKSDFLLRM